jgi:hypothetical protein
MHARDFGEMREQRTLAELGADDLGYVRFVCAGCPRTGKVALAKLRERFAPGAGLVNILNTLLPKDCPHAAPDPWGVRSCKFRYRDL